MPAYDLDDHVRRTIQRAERARAKPPTKGQLPLFDASELTVGRVLARYDKDGLVVDDEMLFSRAVCLHSIEKAYCARRYAEIVGVSMRRKWQLWWIELFAGPGRLYVRDDGSFLLGSPVEAVSIPQPFHGYVFADLSAPCVESLRRRVSGTNVHVLEGDANGADLLDRVATIVPKKALVVLYADQEGLDLRWETLKFFIDRYPHLDLLLNLPVTGVVRALAAGYDKKAASMLDHPDPSSLIETDGSKGAPVRDWYHRKLAAEGFDQVYSHPVKIHSRNRELYDLLLASRHPLARKFFAAAVGEPVAAVRQAAG